MQNKITNRESNLRYKALNVLSLARSLSGDYFNQRSTRHCTIGAQLITRTAHTFGKITANFHKKQVLMIT